MYTGILHTMHSCRDVSSTQTKWKRLEMYLRTLSQRKCHVTSVGAFWACIQNRQFCGSIRMINFSADTFPSGTVYTWAQMNNVQNPCVHLHTTQCEVYQLSIINSYKSMSAWKRNLLTRVMGQSSLVQQFPFRLIFTHDSLLKRKWSNAFRNTMWKE